MRFLADLHVHSKYARATSKNSDLEHHHEWAQLKGLTVVGTGDFTHPAWFGELQEKLEPAEDGLFRLKEKYVAVRQDEVPLACRTDKVRFMLTTEISCIYKKNDKMRKVHHVVWAPDLATVAKIAARLDKIGDINADGRPMIGMTSKDLLALVLDCSPECMFIPAHVWTPWYGVFGSKSGYDSMEECFEELTEYIYAIESGLSSDPAMNWKLPSLDKYTIISNSDAHSPRKLAREANEFDCELSYQGICEAVKTNDLEKLRSTIEFFPEEGKYFHDGHRACGQHLTPAETRELGGVCPVCGKGLTVGVMHRVEELGETFEVINNVQIPMSKQGPILNDQFLNDQNGSALCASGEASDGLRRRPFERLVPLPELISGVLGVGEGSKKVDNEYRTLLAQVGNDMHILREAEVGELKKVTSGEIAEAIVQVRRGEVEIEPGYDGVFGRIRAKKKEVVKQDVLF